MKTREAAEKVIKFLDWNCKQENGFDVPEIRQVADFVLDIVPADDEEPIDRWFMLESGGVARHDYEGDDAIVFKIPKCGFENFLVVYPEDWSFSFWEKKTDHVICTGDARIKTRGDLRRICRALNIPSPSKEESGQR